VTRSVSEFAARTWEESETLVLNKFKLASLIGFFDGHGLFVRGLAGDKRALSLLAGRSAPVFLQLLPMLFSMLFPSLGVLRRLQLLQGNLVVCLGRQQNGRLNLLNAKT
jgi:hypothetical protein